MHFKIFIMVLKLEEGEKAKSSKAITLVKAIEMLLQKK
jgi:hypothetical protein